MKHLTEHLATAKPAPGSSTPRLTAGWFVQLVVFMLLALTLQGCGNKGELFLETDVPINEGLEVLDESVPSSVPGKDTEEDDEKTQKKSR